MTPEVYLASSSPRRRELLAQLNVRFEVVHPHVDEDVQAGESPQQYVVRLALEKARAGWQLLQRQAKPLRLVIGADTCIVCAGEVMGKPSDKEHFDLLFQKLSGAVHQVYSAVAVVGKHPAHDAFPYERYRISKSRVEFRQISAQERETYWQTGEPADKAGGYAIQGLAAAFVKNLNGSYSGVVGLPLFETAQLLGEFGINPIRLKYTNHEPQPTNHNQ